MTTDTTEPAQWKLPRLEQIAKTVFGQLLAFDKDGIMPGYGFVQTPIEQPDGSWTMTLGSLVDGSPVATVVVKARIKLIIPIEQPDGSWTMTLGSLPNPELAHVSVARKRLEAIRPPDDVVNWSYDTNDYDALKEAVEVLCEDIESFDKRHRMHQEEQRDSAKRLSFSGQTGASEADYPFPIPKLEIEPHITRENSGDKPQNWVYCTCGAGHYASTCPYRGLGEEAMLEVPTHAAGLPEPRIPHGHGREL